MAAMNVDAMGFTVNKTNKANAIELMNWVEGPIIVAEIQDKNFIEEAVVSLPCHFVHDTTNDEFINGSLIHNFHQIIILDIDRAEILDSLRLNMEDHIYFNCPILDDKLLEKVDALNQGIVITTSSEDSVGIKSFDELDEIFERIERYNKQD
jgi:hypothetical protein